MIRELFAAELRRLRGPMLVATAGHLLALAALAYVDALFVPTAARQVEASALVAAAGLLLGVAQVAAYRRGGLWGFLMHRPLTPAAVFAALAGAAAAALAVAVALPLALAGGMATLAAPAAGGWRLLVAPYAFGLALTFYFAGVLIALRPWRGAVLAAAPAALLLVPSRLGAGIFLALLAAATWQGWLALAAVRPDLGSPPRRRGALAAAVAPALYLAYVAGTFALLLAYSLAVAFAEQGWRGPARFAWNDYFPGGSFERASYLPGVEAIRHGLEPGEGEASRLLPLLGSSEVADLAPEPGRPLERRVDSIASLAGADLRLDDDALVVLPPGASTRTVPPSAAVARLPLDGPVTNLERVVVAAVDDGLLVSFIHGRRSERGFAPARQSVWLLARDGRATRLAERPLGLGAPLRVRHRGFLLSPALQTADDLLRSTFHGVGPRSATVGELVAHPPPPAIGALALAVAFGSAAATWVLARRRGLAASARRGWTLAALLLGAPVPLVLPLFTRRP